MFEEMDNIIKVFNDKVGDIFNKNKEISDIDKGFLESCIELDETGLGVSFLQNIYKYHYENALAYMVELKVEKYRRSKR